MLADAHRVRVGQSRKEKNLRKHMVSSVCAVVRNNNHLRHIPRKLPRSNIIIN